MPTIPTSPLTPDELVTAAAAKWTAAKSGLGQQTAAAQAADDVLRDERYAILARELSEIAVASSDYHDLTACERDRDAYVAAIEIEALTTATERITAP